MNTVFELVQIANVQFACVLTKVNENRTFICGNKTRPSIVFFYLYKRLKRLSGQQIPHQIDLKIQI